METSTAPVASPSRPQAIGRTRPAIRARQGALDSLSGCFWCSSQNTHWGGNPNGEIHGSSEDLKKKTWISLNPIQPVDFPNGTSLKFFSMSIYSASRILWGNCSKPVESNSKVFEQKLLGLCVRSSIAASAQLGVEWNTPPQKNGVPFGYNIAMDNGPFIDDSWWSTY